MSFTKPLGVLSSPFFLCAPAMIKLLESPGHVYACVNLKSWLQTPGRALIPVLRNPNILACLLQRKLGHYACKHLF